MPSTILSDNGVTSGTAGIKTTGSNDGQLALQTTTAGGTATTALTIDTNQKVSVNTFAVNSNNISADNSLGFRNRIINGDMRIDQHNAGASVSVSSSNNNVYVLDRFKFTTSNPGVYSVQQSTTVPSNQTFVNSAILTVTTAKASVSASDVFGFRQVVEGFNIADLGWGTANAKTVTVSFWVRSSVTGTYSVAIFNSAFTRSYIATYSISSANTWEQKTITIVGDTTGTWLTNNGSGLEVHWDLGCGSDYDGTADAWAATGKVRTSGSVRWINTASATFYITGVQLEVGSVATPFERRPYGTELALCQRYYYKQKASGGNTHFCNSYNSSTIEALGVIIFPVSMRAAPTALEQSGTAGDYRVRHGTTSTTCSSVPTFGSADEFSAMTLFTVASGLTAGQGSIFRSVNATAYLAWSAEL